MSASGWMNTANTTRCGSSPAPNTGCLQSEFFKLNAVNQLHPLLLALILPSLTNHRCVCVQCWPAAERRVLVLSVQTVLQRFGPLHPVLRSTEEGVGATEELPAPEVSTYDRLAQRWRNPICLYHSGSKPSSTLCLVRCVEVLKKTWKRKLWKEQNLDLVFTLQTIRF